MGPVLLIFHVHATGHVQYLLSAAPAAPPHCCRDAVKSIRLFSLHQQLQGSKEGWEAAQAAVLAAPPDPSFAKLHPSYEGVCMGGRRTCTCGAPFFG